MILTPPSVPRALTSPFFLGFAGALLGSFAATVLVLAIWCSPSPAEGTIVACTNDAPTLDWQPQLEQPIAQLKQRLSTLSQQQPMNVTAANLALLYDAKLYMVFQRKLATATDAERATLIQSQHDWLLVRTANAHAAGQQYEGGSMAPMVSAYAFIADTEARIERIAF